VRQETKQRLLDITDADEFMAVLQEIFPDKREISAADLGDEVFKHLIKNVLRQSIVNHGDPREVFIERKRGD